MEFILVREKLSKALNFLTKAISAKASLPILQNILIEQDEGRIKLTATDLDKTIICWLGAKIEGENKPVTVPAKVFQGFVSSVSDDQVSCEITGEKLTVKSSGAKATLNGISAKEYPNLDYSLSKNYIDVKTSLLKEAVTHTYFSTSIDETKPLWTGILLKIVDDKLHFVGLDGFRMSKKELSIKGSGFENSKEAFESVVIPAKNLLEVVKFAGNLDTIKVDIQPSKNVVVFGFEDLLFVSKTLDGEFPDYQAAVPKNQAVVFEVNSADLLAGLRSATIFSSEQNAVKFFIDVDGKRIKLSSDNVEVGTNELFIPINFAEGENLEIGFNAKYLLDLLNNVPSEILIIKCSGQSSPAIFSPKGIENYLHVAVPLQPYWEK